MNQMHGNTRHTHTHTHTHTLKNPLVPQFTMYVMLHKLSFVVLLHLWIFQQKDWCWSWNANTLATWCKELTHCKRPWCWARLETGGEGDNRGWDGCTVSPTQWTWVWINPGSWWWTGRPGMLQSMGVTESCTWLSNWNELNWYNTNQTLFQHHKSF